MPDMETHMPWEATRRGLASELAAIDGVLPGSACGSDPPTLHGPYTQWTRTVAGKTVTRFLTRDQLARYQEWFDNARRLKEIASLHAVEQSEAANTPTAGASKPGASRLRPPGQ
jgi:hypothetical protein